MFRKNKQQNNERKWLFGALLSYYLVKKVFQINKRRRIKEIEGNFKEFLHAEEKEIKRYTSGKEDIAEFAQDSGSIIKDYFIPHSGNNHMPKIIRTKSLAIIVFASLLLKFSLVAYLYFVFPNPSKADDEMIGKILALVNSERKANKAKPLELNAVLSKSALDKASDIVAKDYFAHTSPDGRKPWDFIDRSQYAYSIVGENLAMNFTTAESAHRALVNSPSHKHNILNDKYDDIGLAVVTGQVGGKKTNVLVQLFSSKVSLEEAGKPNVASAPQIVPKSPDIKEVMISKPLGSAKVPETKEKVKAPVSSVAEKEEARNIVKVQKPKSENIVQAAVVPTAKEASSSIPAGSISTATSTSQGGETGGLAEGSATSSGGMLVIEHPGDEAMEQYVAQQLSDEQAENAAGQDTLPDFSTQIEQLSDKHFIFSKNFIYVVQVSIASLLSLLIISLLLNIFIRFEIQHKPVLVRTTLVVLFVAALLFINFHYLEGGTTTILMS